MHLYFEYTYTSVYAVRKSRNKSKVSEKRNILVPDRNPAPDFTVHNLIAVGLVTSYAETAF
jgi:hypothetical protein